MNIGLLHFRVGETDGVSLEMEKWKLMLEELGHKVWYIAGSGDIEDVIYIKELHYQNPTNDLLVNHIYKRLPDQYSEDEIRNILDAYTQDIYKSLVEVIQKYEIDLLIPNNVLSLGWNIAAGKATSQAIEATGIKAIAHHHDFHWERELYSNPRYTWVTDILETYFPPVFDKLRHVVINNIAQKALKDKKNLESLIVPNVFDYEQNWMVTDDYNKTIRLDLGLDEQDIIILQATRIVARKGIELTIRAIKHMSEQLKSMEDQVLYNGNVITKDTKIKLVFVGLNEDIPYYNKLSELGDELGITMVYLGDRFDFDRKEVKGKKIFSLWDAYCLADIVSYPSLLEGFGNQLLEAVYAKKPMMIYEYPVYESYLKEFGLSSISYGNQHSLDAVGLANVPEGVLAKAAQEALACITDPEIYKEMVDKNYKICLKEFSYQTLKELLRNLVH